MVFIWLVYLMLNSALPFVYCLPIPNFLSIWFLLHKMCLPILLLKSLTLKHPASRLSSFKPRLESLYWLLMYSIFISMFYFFYCFCFDQVSIQSAQPSLLLIWRFFFIYLMLQFLVLPNYFIFWQDNVETILWINKIYWSFPWLWHFL